MNILTPLLKEVAENTFGPLFSGHPYWRDMILNADYRRRELFAIALGRHPEDAEDPIIPVTQEELEKATKGLRFNIDASTISNLDRGCC